MENIHNTSTNLSWSLPVKKTLAAGQSVCSRFHSIRGIDFGRLIVVAWFVWLQKFGFFILCTSIPSTAATQRMKLLNHARYSEYSTWLTYIQI
jgi:hypothetical protein